MDPHQHVIRSGRWRRLALQLALVLIASACGDDGTSTAETTTSTTSTTEPSSSTSTSPSTPTSEPSTSSPPPASSSSSSTTTAAPVDEPACPGGGGLPPQAENNTLAAADVDGDGAADTLHSYTIGNPTQIGAWWIQVSFAAGGGSALQILDPDAGLSGVRILDGFDVDGSGTDEFFALVGAGAAVQLLGFFDVDECELRRITVDGQPTEFAVGARLNFVSGLECADTDGDGADDAVIVYSGQRLGESAEFEVTAVQYELQDGQLVQILADGIGGNENDPDFGRLSGADCPGLDAL